VNFSEPFIRRPVLTTVLTAAVILFGTLSYFRLPVNDLPAVDYPVIQVQADYPGASPETVANNIADLNGGGIGFRSGTFPVVPAGELRDEERMPEYLRVHGTPESEGESSHSRKNLYSAYSWQGGRLPVRPGAGSCCSWSPKRWGRLTLNPRPLIDPCGSLILPALALILVAARGVLLLPVFAYAKPMPVDPTFFKNPRRDMNLVVLAGLLANILLSFLAGLLIRAGVTGELETFALAWLIVNAFMFGFQLMPVPGLDGAKLLAPFLPPRPREVYVNAEQYLVLFILVIFFILSGPLLAIVDTFANVACNLAAGIDCLG